MIRSTALPTLTEPWECTWQPAPYSLRSTRQQEAALPTAPADRRWGAKDLSPVTSFSGCPWCSKRFQDSKREKAFPWMRGLCFLRPALAEDPHCEADHVSRDTMSNQQSWGSSTLVPDPNLCKSLSPARNLLPQLISCWAWAAYLLLVMGLCSADAKKVQLVQVGRGIFSTGLKWLKSLVCSSLLLRYESVFVSGVLTQKCGLAQWYVGQH